MPKQLSVGLYNSQRARSFHTFLMVFDKITAPNIKTSKGHIQGWNETSEGLNYLLSGEVLCFLDPDSDSPRDPF